MTSWLRIGQAARVLDLSVDTLRVWDRQGRFTAGRTRGGHRRYLSTDVLALAKKRGVIDALAASSLFWRKSRRQRSVTVPVGETPQTI